MGIPTASEWADMCGDSVSINAWTAYDESVTPVYSPTTVSYPAYIEMKNHTVVDAQGREVMARGKVFIPVPATIDTKDKLTLPVGYVPLNPPIISVNYINDENGNHHTTLEIG